MSRVTHGDTDVFKKRSPSPLSSTPIAEIISRTELKALDRIGTVVQLPAGRPLISTNTLGRQWLVVIDGACEVRQDTRTVARIGAGEFAGELALLTGKRCNADVVTADDSLVYALSKREFSSLLDACPGLSRHVRSVAADRLGTTEPITHELAATGS